MERSWDRKPVHSSRDVEPVAVVLMLIQVIRAFKLAVLRIDGC